MTTQEAILTKLANEHENKYASFHALIENEMSVEVYDLLIQAMEEYRKYCAEQAWYVSQTRSDYGFISFEEWWNEFNKKENGQK